MSESLITKYRPEAFEDVVGQDSAVKALKAAVQKGAGHAFLFSGPSGVGKAQPVTSKVFTPSGWRLIGELVAGDYVYSSDGMPTKVLGVFPQGNRQVYTLEFSDGVSVDCDLEHLWEVNTKRRQRKGRPNRVLSVRELLALEHVQRLYVPLAQPVHLPDRSYTIPPYILGILLGDGYLNASTICFSNPDFDSDIRERVAALLPPGLKLREHKIEACSQFAIIGPRGNKSNPYPRTIKALGLKCLSGDKFIPLEYKLGSVSQRLALLQGLMDTDGSARAGRISYSTTSRKLANDVVELVQSLGGLAWIHVIDNYEMRVNVKMFVCPFASDRKKRGWWSPKKTAPMFARKIRSIYSAERIEPHVCIQVDHPSGLYLTDNFVVTHNTTLARLAAKAFSCEDIQDEDGATNTGIDNIRAVIDGTLFRPLAGANKGIIIDEAHALSKAACQALLKSLEDPPDFVWWFLCTTEPTKLPEAIRTRCLHYTLKEVSIDDLCDLLENTDEGKDVDQDIIGLCAREANGSPRQALANLGVCLEAKDRKEAAELLRSAGDAPQAFELARCLMAGANWAEVCRLLEALKDTNPESIRHVVRAYMTKVALSGKGNSVQTALAVLDAFSKPFHSADGISPVVLACGSLVFSQ